MDANSTVTVRVKPDARAWIAAGYAPADYVTVDLADAAAEARELIASHLSIEGTEYVLRCHGVLVTVSEPTYTGEILHWVAPLQRLVGSSGGRPAQPAEPASSSTLLTPRTHLSSRRVVLQVVPDQPAVTSVMTDPEARLGEPVHAPASNRR